MQLPLIAEDDILHLGAHLESEDSRSSLRADVLRPAAHWPSPSFTSDLSNEQELAQEEVAHY